MEIYPIGTIFALEEQDYMIVGYEDVDVENRYLPVYMTVPYPLGFFGENSLQRIPMPMITNVKHVGYVQEGRGEGYLHMQMEHIEILKNVTVSEMQLAEQKLYQVLNDFIEEIKQEC